MEISENLARFLRYVKIDTQSDDTSEETPSTKKQYDLANLLKKELEELGLKAEIDEWGRVHSFLEGDPSLPVIGLNSHMDTALEESGANVKPQIIENYDGGDIKLNDEVTMSPKNFPALKNRKGQSLVVTDGTTLLGGDDKAGVAIIMSVIAYYVKHKEIPHHPLAILFTPDEEIGRGPEHFSSEKFGAAWAYTIDGDSPYNIECDNFNGSHADVKIEGVGIHPGEAKGKMINAARLIMEFDSLLDVNEKPEYTGGRDGFNHLLSLEADTLVAKAHYIIRNHDAALLEKQKNEFVLAKEHLSKKYPNAKIEVAIKDDYRNMKEVLDKDPRAIVHAEKVMKEMGITPNYPPIRGGTDGATFSFLGCPCPNLGTGSYNHHGKYEYLVIEEFDLMIEIVKNLIKA